MPRHNSRALSRPAAGSPLNAGEPFIYNECLQNLFPIDGVATPDAPGNDIEFMVPDMYGRPWAQIWRRYHEQGMTPPEEEALFGF